MFIFQKSIKNLTVIIALVISVQSFSQSHVFKHYGVEDGLPSSEVYSAFQDSKGYMWFATDAGVSRFNGYEFENFDASDGLTDNTVFIITEDTKGRIWFGTFNCQLSYFENEGIYPYKHNNQLGKGLDKGSILRSFYVDEKDNVWMGFRKRGVYRCDEKGGLKKIENSNKDFSLHINIINANNIVWGLDFMAHKINEDFNLRVSIDMDNKNFDVGIKYKDPRFSNIQLCLIGQDILYYSSANTLVLLEAANSYQPKSIKSLSINKGTSAHSFFYDGQFLWCSTQKEGVFKLKLQGDSLLLIDHFLKEKSVSRVFKDNENGYWFQTLKEGICYLSAADVGYMESPKSSIISIEIDTTFGQMYLGLENGEVSKVLQKENPFQLQTISKTILKSSVLKYDYYDNALLIGGVDSCFGYYQDEKIRFSPQVKGTSNAFDIDGSLIYRVNRVGLSILKNHEEIYNSNASGESRMWSTSVFKNGNRVWIGTNDGIRIYEKGEITNPFKDNKYLSTAIRGIERLNDEVFLIGTKSYGLLVLKNDNIIAIINEDRGLISNLVRAIHVDNQQTIWVGTNKGLSKVNYKTNTNYRITNLTPQHGLVSGEIFNITSYKDTIYSLTPKGVIVLDKTQLKVNSTLPPTFITQFNVNSEEQNQWDNYIFSYQENFITIYFEALNYRSLGEVTYQYRMLGVDSNWSTTTTRKVQYPTLQPNSYEFQVKARNEDGFWGEPVSLSFIISPPYWFTWWFIIGEIALSLLIIILIFKYRLKQLNYKNEVNKKIIDAEKKAIEFELNALRSQMNPHFIFNTLNTIQNAINTLDKKLASNYIASFGRLIRIVLETSKKSLVSLDTEMEMLRLYVDLEAVRFSNKFSYKINVDEKLRDQGYRLPSMIIQPFIENAILHGLVPKTTEDLKLIVDLKLKDDNLIVCVVEDNGIGRTAALKINEQKRLNKKSMGLGITKERLDLYYKETGKLFSCTTTDLMDGDMPLGTKVEIFFAV